MRNSAFGLQGILLNKVSTIYIWSDISRHANKTGHVINIPSNTSFAPIPVGKPTVLDIAEYFESP